MCDARRKGSMSKTISAGCANPLTAAHCILEKGAGKMGCFFSRRDYRTALQGTANRLRGTGLDVRAVQGGGLVERPRKNRKC